MQIVQIFFYLTVIDRYRTTVLTTDNLVNQFVMVVI